MFKKQEKKLKRLINAEDVQILETDKLVGDVKVPTINVFVKFREYTIKYDDTDRRPKINVLATSRGKYYVDVKENLDIIENIEEIATACKNKYLKEVIKWF